VEGRYPFLDVRVMEFCARLPAHLKLFGLTEKLLLRRLGKKTLPESIWSRRKRPYRAPVHRSFFNKDGKTPDYVDEQLSQQALDEAGLFEAASVSRLVQKVCSGAPLSEVEDMALVGILSAQLVHRQFVKDFQKPRMYDQRARKTIIQSTVP
jgi:asparagine synthase (glutamine-hydrolysing)